MRNNKNLKIIIGILVVCLILLGSYSIVCTKKLSTLKSNNSMLTGKVTSLEDKITSLDKKIETIEKAQKKPKNEKLESENKNNTVENKSISCPIYTGNIDTYEKEVISNINLSNNNLEENLKEICNQLSYLSFSNLPINLVKIENVDNKKIAVINLEDTDNMKWSSKYFQGSAGGQITSVSLIESILQRDLNLPWIDGVKFLYNDSPIEYEHTPKLSQTNYR